MRQYPRSIGRRKLLALTAGAAASAACQIGPLASSSAEASETAEPSPSPAPTSAPSPIPTLQASRDRIPPPEPREPFAPGIAVIPRSPIAAPNSTLDVDIALLGAGWEALNARISLTTPQGTLVHLPGWSTSPRTTRASALLGGLEIAIPEDATAGIYTLSADLLDPNETIVAAAGTRFLLSTPPAVALSVAPAAATTADRIQVRLSVMVGKYLEETLTYVSVDGPSGLWYVVRSGMDRMITRARAPFIVPRLSNTTETLLDGPLGTMRGSGNSADAPVRIVEDQFPIDFGDDGTYVWRAWMEDAAGGIVGAVQETVLTIASVPDPIELAVSGSHGGPRLVRVYDGRSGSLVDSLTDTGDGDIRLEAVAGPKLVTVEEFAPDGTLSVGGLALDAFGEQDKPVVQLDPISSDSGFRPVEADIEITEAPELDNCATPVLLVAGATASGDVTSAEAEYVARYFASRLALANPFARVYTSSDTLIAREVSARLADRLGISDAPPPRSDLIIGLALSRNSALSAALTIDIFLVNAATGQECDRGQLTAADAFEVTFAVEEFVATISPVAGLYAECGWICHRVSFELEIDSVDAGAEGEARTRAAARWEGTVAVMPDMSLSGSAAASLAYSRQFVQSVDESDATLICSDVYSDPGDLAVSIIGRQVGDSLRIGFVPIARAGILTQTCGGETTQFSADIAQELMAPLGRRTALLPARPGAVFHYRGRDAGMRAQIAIEKPAGSETPDVQTS